MTNSDSNGTTENCKFIGGHKDGYDSECFWCAGHLTRPVRRSNPVATAIFWMLFLIVLGGCVFAAVELLAER